MPTTQRRVEPGLIDRLLEQPSRFNFFQAMRLLDLWLRRGVAAHARTLDGVMRFKNSVSLSFPPSQIEAIAVAADADDASASARIGADSELATRRPRHIHLTPAFMGFLGVNGVLPYDYTSTIAAQIAFDKNEARRLAALITMIRDYDADGTVSIVAHSQGCMLSLLAQAFLLETGDKALQPDARPADTLILCNPPYSLVDETPMLASSVDYYSGGDAAMAKRYPALSGGQTLHARLTTLANIVNGVQKKKHATPTLAELPNTSKHRGVVGAKWVAGEDRDNRGKVYLYFSPEDMTVGLANVQGIGWQGVPDYMRGTQVSAKPYSLTDEDGETLNSHTTITKAEKVVRTPLAELGAGFFQRVFTIKRRPDFRTGAPVLLDKNRLLTISPCAARVRTTKHIPTSAIRPSAAMPCAAASMNWAKHPAPRRARKEHASACARLPARPCPHQCWPAWAKARLPMPRAASAPWSGSTRSMLLLR